MAKMTIPKDTTYDLPEGRFLAKLIRVKPSDRPTSRGPQPWIRLVWSVNVPGMDNLNTLAGRNFVVNLEPGSELRNFLEQWFGRDFFKKNAGKAIDLEDYIGKEGEVTLVHYQGQDFETPHVSVVAIKPVTTTGNTGEKEVLD